MARKKVTAKQYNGNTWDELYFCTLASLVTLNDGDTVQNKIEVLATQSTTLAERVGVLEEQVEQIADRIGTKIIVEDYFT